MDEEAKMDFRPEAILDHCASGDGSSSHYCLHQLFCLFLLFCRRTLYPHEGARVLYKGKIGTISGGGIANRMRLVYFIIAWISLVLGLIGIVLPVLPTTPFLLLTVVCFSKSSTRFEEWFQQTKLYRLYVADYRETKSIAKSRKKKIIIYIYILMAISIYFAPILAVKIGLGALTIFITYYLFWVIPDKK